MKALVRYGESNKTLLAPNTYRTVLYRSTNEEMLNSECERLNKSQPEFRFEVEEVED